MAKGPKGRKFNNSTKTPKKSVTHLSDSDMDDEIDAFHKQRDVVPLDLDDDIGESDEDNDHHVFPIEDGSSDDEDEDEDEDEDDSEDDTQLTGFAAKIAKQSKSLRAKIGGAADEAHDDDEDAEEKSVAWGRRKGIYYDNDKGESSDDELLDEEEAEVLRQQKAKATAYSNADHGLEDDEDESEGDRTLEEILHKGKAQPKPVVDSDAQDEADTSYEVVKKDLNALSREEQMDIVFNSAPELVGLLSELNDSVEQLENKVAPILSKVKDAKNLNKNFMQYMEMKKQLLLSYCQAITFHLLLKCEGQPVRDHPVVARLVEIKNLLDKTKQLDENLSFDVEDILERDNAKIALTYPEDMVAVESISLTDNSKTTVIGSEIQKEIQPCVETEFLKMDSLADHENRVKRKRQNDQLGLQSVEMLKVRAALEEKLKQKGLFNLKGPKPDGAKKNLKLLNGKLEALDDFDDDALDIERTRNRTSNGHANVTPSSRLSQLVTPQMKKAKIISGDDDIPKRDDIGERRRKHEIRVLATAGIKSDDDDVHDEEADALDGDKADDMDEDGNTDSETDLYKEAEIKHAAKRAAKAQKNSRTAPSLTALPETLSDGKRHINYEMEKNRGLTRKRNKDIKNPRKKYKLKHKKKEVARKGQVRAHRTPTGPYGGEGSGINTISRSIRFKN